MGGPRATGRPFRHSRPHRSGPVHVPGRRRSTHPRLPGGEGPLAPAEGDVRIGGLGPGGDTEDAAPRRAAHGRLRPPHLLSRPGFVHRGPPVIPRCRPIRAVSTSNSNPSPLTHQPTSPQLQLHEESTMHMRAITSQLTERARSVAEAVMTVVRFLRAYVSARLTPVLGDERGEIASWVVVTALVIVAAIAIVRSEEQTSELQSLRH